ncbi:hypothetical protein DB41_DL00080 [Neochlamydia sp. TUME1]|nr:hypothetical protein DB41_DL00080 [Neochlamydia sp. TUME1]
MKRGYKHGFILSRHFFLAQLLVLFGDRKRQGVLSISAIYRFLKECKQISLPEKGAIHLN